MQLQEALALVRRKYAEESAGDWQTAVAQEFDAAHRRFPVVMEVALQLFARDLVRGVGSVQDQPRRDAMAEPPRPPKSDV